MTPLPCPHCGQELQQRKYMDGSTYQHRCPVPFFRDDQGITHIREYNIDKWNDRPLATGVPVSYEVLDGTPVFNNAGRGTQADASFINKCFEFLLDHWKKNSK